MAAGGGQSQEQAQVLGQDQRSWSSDKGRGLHEEGGLNDEDRELHDKGRGLGNMRRMSRSLR